jgi:3-hydroxybutyryl-CoA dehydrogenase
MKRRQAAMNVDQILKVAVVDAGVMGTGIALAFARAGFRVAVVDMTQRRLDLAQKTLAKDCQALLESGLLANGDSAPIIDGVSLVLWGDEAIKTADFVIEAAPEILDVKQKIFERCGSLCRPDVVIASNTSTISIAEIAARMNRPERAIVTHWFIPPHVTPIVEVVPGGETSPHTVQLTKAVLERADKRPIVCKENPGLIHNFIEAAMTRAAMILVEKGVASSKDVDEVVTHGFALRLAQLGVLQSADYAGLETALRTLQYIFAKTGDAAFKPPAILERKVAEKELGLKSGKGFYAYGPDDVTRISALANSAVMNALKNL